jgi:hypothetical protein
MSINCPKINFCVVSKTFNISVATCPTGTHEKAAWKARRSCENVCVCGLNALPRWDFKPKVPALLSSICHLHHPPPPLITSQSIQWHQKQHYDSFPEALEILMMYMGLPGATFVLVLTVRRICSEASSSPLTINRISASKNCLQSR